MIDGTIVAPDNRKDWNPKFSRLWLDFYNLTGVLFRGIAVIEGSGSKWWAASCKKNKTNASLEQRISQLVQEKAAFSEEEFIPRCKAKLFIYGFSDRWLLELPAAT
ncbi:hypothetical protein Droror1_Dr00021366 [Drosera rotundifolia]